MPDTTPLRFNGAIVTDAVQKNLDEARRQYRLRYDRGYVLSMKGRHEEADRILATANKALHKAELCYETARR